MSAKAIECPQCAQRFRRQGDCNRHIDIQHDEPKFVCGELPEHNGKGCDRRFKRRDALHDHRRKRGGRCREIAWNRRDSGSNPSIDPDDDPDQSDPEAILNWLNQALTGICEQIAAVRIEEFFPLDDLVSRLQEQNSETLRHEPDDSFREHTDPIVSGYASDIIALWDDLPVLPGMSDSD
ncbi:MAG: hypothetical protein Q9160_001985 [Pyrenula sp. 1 TL-2023]